MNECLFAIFITKSHSGKLGSDKPSDWSILTGCQRLSVIDVNEKSKLIKIKQCSNM